MKAHTKCAVMLCRASTECRMGDIPVTVEEFPEARQCHVLEIYGEPLPKIWRWEHLRICTSLLAD